MEEMLVDFGTITTHLQPGLTQHELSKRLASVHQDTLEFTIKGIGRLALEGKYEALMVKERLVSGIDQSTAAAVTLVMSQDKFSKGMRAYVLLSTFALNSLSLSCLSLSVEA